MSCCSSTGNSDAAQLISGENVIASAIPKLPKVRDSKSGLWRLPDGPGHYSYRDRERNQWGSTAMTLFLIELSAAWAAGPGRGRSPFSVGDLSLSNGDQPGGHKTHRQGFRVDIGALHLVRSARRQENSYMVHWKSPFYDQAGMMALIALMRRLIEGRYKPIEIYYNDPAVQKVWPGRIVSLINHDEHLHMGLDTVHPWPGIE